MKVNSLKVYWLHIPLISSVSKVFHIVINVLNILVRSMPEVWSISTWVTCKVIMTYLLNFYWSLCWSSFFFTSFFVPVGNVIAVVRKRIRRCEVDWLKSAGQTARDLDWLITLPSLLTFSKFLAVRKRPSMKPDHSVSCTITDCTHSFLRMGYPAPCPGSKRGWSEKSSLLD